MAMAYRSDGISDCHTPGPHTRLMAPGRMSDKDAADTTSPGNSPGRRSARPAYDRCRTANARTGIALRPTERPPRTQPLSGQLPAAPENAASTASRQNKNRSLCEGSGFPYCEPMITSCRPYRLRASQAWREHRISSPPARIRWSGTSKRSKRHSPAQRATPSSGR